MPLPVILPALIALGLTVAETISEERPQWTVDIGRMDFFGVSRGRLGYVCIDFADRKIVSWIDGDPEPSIHIDYKLPIAKFNGDSVRRFFESDAVIERLERVRSGGMREDGSFDQSVGDFQKEMVGLHFHLTGASKFFGRFMGSRSLFSLFSHAHCHDWNNVVEQLLVNGDEVLLSLAGDEDIVTAEKQDINDSFSVFLLERLRHGSLFDLEDVEVKQVPWDDPEAELRSLIDLPSDGFILRSRVSHEPPYTYYSDEEEALHVQDLFREEAERHPDNYEWLGPQGDRVYAWRLWKR